PEFAMEHMAALDGEAAGEHAFQLRVDRLDGNGREETQAAEIHGEERDVAAADGAGRGEQGDVTAEHDEQLRAFGNLGSVEAFCGGAFQPVFGGFAIEPRRDSTSIEPCEQFRHESRCAIAVWFRNYRDGGDLSAWHRAKTRGCLRPHESGFRRSAFRN